MTNGGSLAGSRRGVLRLVVLAATAVARFPRGNGGRSTLAMAGCASVGAGIRWCPALRSGTSGELNVHMCSLTPALKLSHFR